ncbi:hypothetical protein NE237_003204 [Protea cynaroides]|uniref:Uncharacterized protein n=1 Tax=Protea cynaroides TaxID=273540 RepID=A0A9Q0QS79_9MAGN|nr:hypothetical protein NE237_003204 [Protea cynaroides]
MLNILRLISHGLLLIRRLRSSWTAARGGSVVSPTVTFHGKLQSCAPIDISHTITTLSTRGEAPATVFSPGLDVFGTAHSLHSSSTLGSGAVLATMSPVQFYLTQQALIQDYISHHPTLATAILNIAPQLSSLSRTCPLPSPVWSFFTLETQSIPLSEAMPPQVIPASSSRSKRPRHESDNLEEASSEEGHFFNVWPHGGWGESAPWGAMKLFCWNCQGLGRALTVHALFHLLKSKHQDILFFMETRLSRSKLLQLFRRSLYPHFFIVDPIHSAGGLALF